MHFQKYRSPEVPRHTMDKDSWQYKSGRRFGDYMPRDAYNQYIATVLDAVEQSKARQREDVLQAGNLAVAEVIHVQAQAGNVSERKAA
jgi:hypothetical protein